MGKPKIVLFHPRTLHEKNYRYYHVPYSILAVASGLDLDHFDIILIDDNVHQKVDYSIELKTLEPDLLCVGISSMVGAQIGGGIEFAKAVRNLSRHIPIIWGGPLPTMLPQETASHWCVDIAVRGQGEITFREIVECLESERALDDLKGISYRRRDGKVIHNPSRPFIDLNKFPPYTKVYHLLNLENYIWPDEHIANRTISYHSSQGCPFNCGFCCEVALWRRWWSGLSASRILDDIEYLVKQYDVNGIKFYDSEFFINRKRVFSFAQGLLDRGLKIRWAASIHPRNLYKMTDDQLDLLHRSGLARLLVGAESGVQEELDLIGKNITKSMIFDIARRCARHKIVICFTFVTGYPSMPSSYIDETLAFAEELHRFEPMHEAKIHFYAPYPGAPLYQLALDFGFEPPTTLEEWAQYDYYEIMTPWVDQKYLPIFRKFNETHYPYMHPYQLSLERGNHEWNKTA